MTTKHTAPKYLDDGSPIAAFVMWLRSTVAMRKFFAVNWGHADVYSAEFMDDLTMLLEENVTIGLRSSWVRRVCVPIVMAQRELDKDGPAEPHVLVAAEIIAQLKEGTVRQNCLTWLKEKFPNA